MGDTVKELTNAFRESTTLKCCLTALALLFFKYLVSGQDIGFGENPDITALEFGGAFGLCMAPWLHREWRKSRYHKEM